MRKQLNRRQAETLDYIQGMLEQLDTRKNRVWGTDNVKMAGWVRVLGGFGATFDDGVSVMGFSRDSGQTHGVTARFS